MRLPSSNTCAAPVIHPSNSHRSSVGSRCVYKKHRPGPGCTAKERQRSEPSYVRYPSTTPICSVLTLHLHSQPSNTYHTTSRSSYQVPFVDFDRWEQRESKDTEKKPAESSARRLAGCPSSPEPSASPSHPLTLLPCLSNSSLAATIDVAPHGGCGPRPKTLQTAKTDQCTSTHVHRRNLRHLSPLRSPPRHNQSSPNLNCAFYRPVRLHRHGPVISGTTLYTHISKMARNLHGPLFSSFLDQSLSNFQCR
jgi:hypothetical protein